MMLLTRRTLAAVAAFGLVASASAANGPAEQENYDDANVITLTSTDFSDVGSLPTPMLVDFYAPWCGHCKHLAPAYARAADIIAAEGGGMRLAKFDATTDGQVAHKYGLSGYPTLVLFNKDGSTDNLKQLGPHNDAWIANWMRRRVLGTAAIKRLASATEVSEFRAVAEVVCVLFSDGESDDFDAVALRWGDPSLRWAIAPAALASEFAKGSGGGPTAAVFRQTGDVTAVLDTPGWGQKELTSFVHGNDVPSLLRRVVLLNTWMHIIVLLGERAADKHEHPFRQVYDFAAKGQSVVYDSNIISQREACDWILAAGGSDEKMDLSKPTAAYIFVEKGIVKQVELYGKPLIGPGLTIGSKGDPGTATQALAEWSMQFGDDDGGEDTIPSMKMKQSGKEKLPPLVKDSKETKLKVEKAKKKPAKEWNVMPPPPSKGASPHMKLGGAMNHVHVLLKQSVEKLSARALQQGVPAKDVEAAKESKEAIIALMYEWSDDAKAAGTLGQSSTTSKEIRAGKYDTDIIDHATGNTKIWQATVDSIKDPEERAHAQAKYAKMDEQLAKQKNEL